MKDSSKSTRQAVCYARYARTRSAAEQCNSCAEQLDGCPKIATSKGWHIVGEFQDDAMAGKRADNRPGLQQAMEVCTEKKATLVVYSLSRLGHNARETHRIVEGLLCGGSDLVVVQGDIDTSQEPVGRLLLTVLAAAAEQECERIAERTADAMHTQKSKGRRMSARIPFGYAADPEDPSRIIKDPYEQSVIKRVKELGAEGKRLVDICRTLSKEGYKPRQYRRRDGSISKGSWQHTTIKKILDS